MPRRQTRRLTGVAANDCHHNQVLIVKMVDAETVRVGTNVDPDDQMRSVSAALRPGIRALTKGHNPGDVLARLDIDPYQRSFRNMSTHILARTLDEPSIRMLSAMDTLMSATIGCVTRRGRSSN